MQPFPTKLTLKMGGKKHEIKVPAIQGHQESIEKDRTALGGPTAPPNNDGQGHQESIEKVQVALGGPTVPSNSAVQGHQETIQKDQSALGEPTVPSNGTVQDHQETIQKDQTVVGEPADPSNSDSGDTDVNIVDVSSPEYNTEDEVTVSNDDYQKQMVLYDPTLNGAVAIKAQPLSGPFLNNRRIVPEVGAFTVQCAKCFKWRLIPDQEKYEVIREHITDEPFLCKTTRQWDREVSCDDPTDIEQDGTRIWAIDKPNIAQPPPGWKRLLRLRSEGSSKFADVYYVSPTGNKLRSMPEIGRYMKDHPEHFKGFGLDRFSFQIPKPLRENYVRKRPTTQTPAPKTPDSLEPKPAEPVPWAEPEDNTELQIVEPLAWARPEANGYGMAENMAPEIVAENRASKKARYN